MPSTIYDVAKYTGLSIGTISKFINGKPVKEANRIKIEKAIDVLNFTPNNIAKGLRQSKSFTIAVLCSEITSEYSTAMISSIEKYFLPFGYSIIVSQCFDDPDLEIKRVKFLISKKVDGIILMPFSLKGRQLEYIKQSNVPVVVVDQMIINHECDCVVLDNEKSIYVPTTKVIEKGHTKIALLTGNPKLYTASGRISGYRKAMSDHHIPISEDLIINGNYKADITYNEIMKFYKKGIDLPTAIVCTNYDTTMGAVLAMHTLNLQISKDISLTGFDNLTLSNIMSPKLYTVEQPINEMGISAAKLIYKRITGDYSDYPQIIYHEPKFIDHDSIQALHQ